MMKTGNFRTSSKCKADDPMCVEVAVTTDEVGVRDTKVPEHERPMISFGRDAWASFIKSV